MSAVPLVRIARDARIVGGVPAAPHEFPHQVALTYYDVPICGGSIISSMLILTAAHCIFSSNMPQPRIFLFKVLAGLQNITDEGENVQIRNVKFIYLHDNYDPQTFENDIALLVMSEPLRFTDTVKRIDLPKQDEEFRGVATVTGWGKTELDGKGSVALKKVTAPIISPGECRASYKGKYNITAYMICMGCPGKDSCEGDSGGAAICAKRGFTTVQCGIVSFGHKCGEIGFPGVYTSVSKYINWIDGIEDQILALPRNEYPYVYHTLDSGDPNFFIMSGLMEQPDFDGIGCIPQTFLCHNVWNSETLLKDRFKLRQCIRGEFRCNNGRCIRRELTCDTMDDCEDGSDEIKCERFERKTCESGEHQCGVFGQCYHNQNRCDGHFSCYDHSDEEGCEYQKNIYKSATFPCFGLRSGGIFYCSKDFRCIDHLDRCDGVKDCPSGEDERYCISRLRDFLDGLNWIH